MKTIKDIPELENKRVFVRVDWNGESEYRIKKTLPTVEYLLERGAKVVLATHLEPSAASTETLQKYVPAGAELLENLRHNPGEQNGDLDYAKYLAGKADIYVNEAFSASHRNHASIVGIPQFIPGYAGMRFTDEVEALSKAFNPPHPFFLILGGAKGETKLPLVEKFLNIADHIFIAGTLAPEVYEKYKDNPKVTFPHGDITALDVDEKTIANCKLRIENSRFIVWNGPLGKYEDGYTEGTQKLAQVLANSGKEVIVGGGDTLAVIQDLDLLDKFSFASTGGGAMLSFLANETLPGIEVLAD